MISQTKLLATAAALAVVFIGGALLLSQRNDQPSVGGSPPSPSPLTSATPNVSPSPSLGPIDTSDWLPYTSSRYGFSIAYPPTEWNVIPGDDDWTFEEDVNPLDSTTPDRFETQGAGDGLGIRLSVWSDKLDPGTTNGDWIEAYCARHEPGYEAGSCTERDLSSEVGGVNRIVGWNNPLGEPMALLRMGEGDTIYVLAIWRHDGDPSVRPWGGSQRLLEGFLSTMTVPDAAPENSPAGS